MLKFRMIVACFVVCIICSGNGLAQPTDKEILINSCAEVADVMEYMDGISKFIFDADADAVLKAGYCMGTLNEYRRANHLNCNNNIIQGANWISKLGKYNLNMRQLLNQSCQ